MYVGLKYKSCSLEKLFFDNFLEILFRSRNELEIGNLQKERDLSLRFDNSRERMKGKSVSNSVKKSSSFLVEGRRFGWKFFYNVEREKECVYRMEKSAGCFVYAKLVR